MKIKFNKIKALATGALLLSVLSVAVVNAQMNKKMTAIMKKEVVLK